MKKENYLWSATKTGLVGGAIAVFLCLIGRHQDVTDEAHIVEIWQPKDAHTTPRRLERQVDQRRVVHQVVVAEHDALGRAPASLQLWDARRAFSRI